MVVVGITSLIVRGAAMLPGEHMPSLEESTNVLMRHQLQLAVFTALCQNPFMLAEAINESSTALKNANGEKSDRATEIFVAGKFLWRNAVAVVDGAAAASKMCDDEEAKRARSEPRIVLS